MRHALWVWFASLLLLGSCAKAPEHSLTGAAARGDAAAVQAILARGADPNQTDGHGLTAIILAARAGSVPCVRALLERGADPNRRGGVNGWTPLMHAVHKNRHATAQALLDGGAEADARNPNGVTALIMAAGYGNTPMVELLLDRGADLHAQAADGATVFAAAVGGVPDIDNFTLGSCQISTIEALRRRDPNLHLPDNFWGATAKMAAAAAKLRGCPY
jgi:ankyrin repeat protein